MPLTLSTVYLVCFASMRPVAKGFEALTGPYLGQRPPGNEPEGLPHPANQDCGEAYPSASRNGSVYFFSWRRQDRRGDDIFRSRFQDGAFQEVERLPWPLNTEFNELDPCVAPDEGYLVFSSGRSGGFGGGDNYISFQREDGSWTHPINLGQPLNSSSYDLCANGTPDGSYFFFTSARRTEVDKGDIGKREGSEENEDTDLYWVDSAFIEALKGRVLHSTNATDVVQRAYETTGIDAAIEIFHDLYLTRQDDHLFPPYELLTLSIEMMNRGQTHTANLLFAALDERLPRERNVAAGYGQLCILHGFVDKGLGLLEAWSEKTPGGDLADQLGRIGYLLTPYPDKSQDALQVLLFTAERYPEDPWAHFGLARVYRELGDLDQAIESCTKSLELRPDVGDISEYLDRLIRERDEKR
jgi:tetratricopeptide (TPR) repeat protein